jgi:hypothetical protein
MSYINVNQLIGLTFSKIQNESDTEIKFYMNINDEEVCTHSMYHGQDCCENVYIEDINGNLEDLIGVPILSAEQVSNYEPTLEKDIKRTEDANVWGCCTWTFYKFATIKGYVTIRWYEEGNGYYSESVNLVELL